MSISRKAPKLACAAAFAALCLIGWVGNATLAQDPVKEAGTAPPSDSQPTALSIPQSLDVPKVDGAKALGAALPEPPIAQVSADESEDPEKAALEFVVQNQKFAESQLNSLKADETKLRTRLQKVEGAIKRWEALLGALKQSQGALAVAMPAGNAVSWKQAAPPLGLDREPTKLEPIDPNPKPLELPTKN